ncbi:hypothetical protein [Bacillus sp. FSL K6-3431]|uniref:hypothetical protein n=1 Tax=Bacillus sp. FSL K6-3431 TaxID=2921500 RepID=UPI0030FA4C20
MKTSTEDLPVVLVGCDEALGNISGTVERIYTLVDQSYHDLIEEAKSEAIQAAIDSGANPAKIKIIKLEDFPLAYLPGNAA